MNTLDGFHVSSLTKMCEHHNNDAMAYVAMALDFIGPQSDTWGWESREEECRYWLARTRAECLEQCGRIDETGAVA